MLVLGFDFETTGVDTTKDDIIEYAFVLYELSRKVPLILANGMVQTGLELTSEITELTGITAKDLEMYGQKKDVVAEVFKYFVENHDIKYLVSHNGSQFDLPLLERYLESKSPVPMIDTMTDLPFPTRMQTRKLSYIAAEAGFLNPFSHRALFDVMTMLKILETFNIDEVIKLANSKTLTVQAMTGFSEKEKAKEAKFHWDGDKKMWLKQIKECSLDAVSKEWGFKYRILEDV